MTRDEAIEWLLCLGDLELRGIRSPQNGEHTGNLLAWEAFAAVPDKLGTSWDTGYIEAAYPLMDGWNPGDPVYPQEAK